MNKKKRNRVIVLIVILIVIVGWWVMRSQNKIIKVAVENPIKRDLIASITGIGKLYPEKEVAVNISENGEVVSVKVQEGDMVSKGQILAVVKTTSSNPLAAMNIPQLNMNASSPKETIKYVNIYAPISGVVVYMNMTVGQKTSSVGGFVSQDMMRIADLTVWNLQVPIVESEIKKIHLQDTAILKLEAYADKEIKGVVSRIAYQNTSNSAMGQLASGIAEQTATYKVFIKLIPETYKDISTKENNFQPFLSGMSASADIRTQYKYQVLSIEVNAVTIDKLNDSIQQENNNKIQEIVYVVNSENIIEKKKIKTDLQYNDWVEIVSGLQESDKVVVAPYIAITELLKEGMKVKVVNKKELFNEVTN